MDFDKTQLEKYEKYIDWFNSFIKRCFENQSEYIHCKAGCSKCCEKGEYPLSELEFQYLLNGFNKMDEKVKKEIFLKIEKLRKNREKLYECPFLFDRKCSIYTFRPLICRSYGLLSYEGEKIKAPFCIDLGLNFSSILDKNTGKITDPDILNIPYKNKPLAYNVSLSHLTKNKMCADIVFGEKRTLIDFLADYTKENQAD